MLPIFRNAEEPYRAWKNAVLQTALKEEMQNVVSKARKQSNLEATLVLGNFITSNPHEDGNYEFVFGDFDEEALGRIAYDDLIEDAPVIEKLISQLEIELSIA